MSNVLYLREGPGGSAIWINPPVDGRYTICFKMCADGKVNTRIANSYGDAVKLCGVLFETYMAELKEA